MRFRLVGRVADILQMNSFYKNYNKNSTYFKSDMLKLIFKKLLQRKTKCEKQNKPNKYLLML